MLWYYLELDLTKPFYSATRLIFPFKNANMANLKQAKIKSTFLNGIRYCHTSTHTNLS